MDNFMEWWGEQPDWFREFTNMIVAMVIYGVGITIAFGFLLGYIPLWVLPTIPVLWFIYVAIKYFNRSKE